MAEPLSGYRILDLSEGIAGPIGTLLLAEQGAEVIKVEPLGGDPFRNRPGFGYPVWNRSKRSIVLDLESADGKAAFRELLATADVLVESARPGGMEAIGLGYEQLRDAYPRLIYLALPGYPSKGSRSQRPSYDPLIAAWSGQAFTQAAVDRPDGPAYLYMPMSSMASCYLTATAVTVALRAREKTGKGQRVETSLFQGSLLYTTMLWQYVENTGRGGFPMPKTNNTTLYECGDGLWAHVLFGARGSQDRFAKIVGLPPMGVPTMRQSQEERAKRQEAEAAACKRFTREELLRECWANDVPAQPVQPMDQMYTDPQFMHNGMVQTVTDPELGRTTQIGIPLRLDGAPGSIKGGQPRVGQHTQEILSTLNLSTDVVERLVAAVSTGR